MRILLLLSVCLFPCLVNAAEKSEWRTLKQWRFSTPGNLQGWQPGSIKDAKVSSAGLSGEPTNKDPLITGPLFEIPASQSQVVRVVMRSESGGESELYYTNTTQGKYGGFSSSKRIVTPIRAGREFETYDITPFWGPEKKIIRLRFDPPNGGKFEIASIEILERPSGDVAREKKYDFRTAGTAKAWRASGAVAGAEGATIGGTNEARLERYLAVDTEQVDFVAVRMAAPQGVENARLRYAVTGASGLYALDFPLRADGQMHTYNLLPGAKHMWAGELAFLSLSLTERGAAQATVESISLGVEPMGPTELEMRWFGVAESAPRAGRPVTLCCVIQNNGGETADRTQARLIAPAGVQLLGEAKVPVESIPYSVTRTIEWKVVAPAAGRAAFRVEVSGSAGSCQADANVEFLPAVEVTRADYVPPPRPVDTGDYEIGVYYFPGWAEATRWAPVQAWPNRRPALGWYREGSPEVADWQIKWMLEHGITWIAYDWYWNKGARHLEHGIHEAFFNARYQNLMKFCLLYANHNPPGSTSVEDSIELTKFWLANYFKRPNYLKVDGKPVMIIFSPRRISDDVGHDNVRAMFQKMDAVCQAEGIPGIYMVACTAGDPKTAAALKEEGYAALSGYNYPGQTGKVGRLPYSLLSETTERIWSQVAEAGILKPLPVITAGWEPRPWHGPNPHFFFPDMNPPSFQKHCEAAKKYLDANVKGRKLAIIEAWNELGEGSYIEPHAEFGFGYVDAVRSVFAPQAGPHVDLVPADVGLGPYDVAPSPRRTAWEFNTADDREGWAVSQADQVQVGGGNYRFVVTGRDPVMMSPRLEVPASKFGSLTIRVKASEKDTLQLFWATTAAGVNEPTSLKVPVSGDNQFHEYTFDLAGHRRWRGMVVQFRLDPGSVVGNRIEIDSIRLVPRAGQ